MIKKISFIILVILIIFLIINNKDNKFRIVKIKDFNRNYKIYTEKTSIIKILELAKIKLNEDDLIYPDLKTKLNYSDSEITICRVKKIYRNKIIKINQKVIYAKTKALPKGQKLIINPGSKGFREDTYKILYINGRKARQEKIDVKLICKPRSKVVLLGVSESKKTFKNQKLKKGKILNIHATAYSPAANSCAPFNDGFTAIGLRANYGVVAVDPKFINLGTLLYIEGYGYAIAGDVGSAIKKNDIDLCFNNEQIAREFGVKEVKAYILE